LATWTAIRPALPVAASTSTLWPGAKSIRRRRATHEAMAGFIAAAMGTGSVSAGRTMLRRRSTTVRSAMAPRLVSGRTKYRRLPSGARPTPSTPGTSGSSPELV
jgi:hypothetical protein